MCASMFNGSPLIDSLSIQPKQEAYVRLIEALSEGTDRTPSALLKYNIRMA